MDHLSGDIDPFSDLDSLQDLLVHIQPELSPQEYIEADENLAVLWGVYLFLAVLWRVSLFLVVLWRVYGNFVSF